MIHSNLLHVNNGMFLAGSTNIFSFLYSVSSKLKGALGLDELVAPFTIR